MFSSSLIQTTFIVYYIGNTEIQCLALQEWDASAPEASGLLLPLARAPLSATIPGSKNLHVQGSGKSNCNPYSADSKLRHWQIKGLAQRKFVGKLKLEASFPEARTDVSATGTLSEHQRPVQCVNNSWYLLPQRTGSGEGDTFLPKYRLLYFVVLGFWEGEEGWGRAVKQLHQPLVEVLRGPEELLTLIKQQKALQAEHKDGDMSVLAVP